MTGFSLWSRWQGSNLRHPVPKTGALPTALHLGDNCIFSATSALTAGLNLKANISGQAFTGNISAPSFTGTTYLETIKDSNGNNRFVEGELNLLNTVPAGLTKVYGKWSLSGSHLLIVLCINATNGTTISADICQFELPEWVADKIYPIASEYVDYKSFSLFADNLSTQQLQVFLRKYPSKVFSINTNSLTLTADRTGRIAFDLLIDNN